MPVDRTHRSNFQLEDEHTFVERRRPSFSTRYDPISKQVLFKSKTESQMTGSTIGTRANFQYVKPDVSKPNIFSRRHAIIAREKEVANMKVMMAEAVELAEKEARRRNFYERKPTREEMRRKDRQVLVRVAFETYERKWGQMAYPEIIKIEEQEDAKKDTECQMNEESCLKEEDIVPYLRFVDIPWPLFTVVHSLSQFSEKLHELTSFLRHPEIHKYFDGVEQKDGWKLQQVLWNPKKFHSRVLRKVVEEDREDVRQAYLRVKEVLWKEDTL